LLRCILLLPFELERRARPSRWSPIWHEFSSTTTRVGPRIGARATVSLAAAFVGVNRSCPATDVCTVLQRHM